MTRHEKILTIGYFWPMKPSNKHLLRKRYREKRIELSAEEFRVLNRQLQEQVDRLDMAGLLTVHLFLPIAGNREPDTYAIAERLRHRYPDMRLVLPKTEQGSQEMRHIRWDKDTVLITNHWGIPEPEAGEAIPPIAIDAVFVPLLAFDTRGNRVGYGKGFYDRFLAECGPCTAKIGLSLFEAEETISDISAYDIPLDMCITPSQTWSFNTVP